MTGLNEQQANQQLSFSVIKEKEKNSYKRNTDAKFKELSRERPNTDSEASQIELHLKTQGEEEIEIRNKLIMDDESDTSVHLLDKNSAYQSSNGTNIYKRSNSRLTSTSITRFGSVQ